MTLHILEPSRRIEHIPCWSSLGTSPRDRNPQNAGDKFRPWLHLPMLRAGNSRFDHSLRAPTTHRRPRGRSRSFR
ncbi:hypothetical protein FGO68_gene15028 [Halteria grandinella]|uniref:Uncharacterized protein n=1 Tax=Halteria grandinella TaxID=5974 RepID=A0A8J8SUX8_HALGN|nr:hypothetical protein FGO68_gene15028 [Halteria grandinella]